MIFIISIFIVLIILSSVGGFFLLKRARRERLIERLNTALLSVKLAKATKEEKGDVKSEIALSEQLLSVLASFKKPFTLEVAVAHVGEEIVFYVSLPKNLVESATRQIQGLWGDAQVESAPEYNIFNPHGETQGCYVLGQSNFALPLRTYEEVGSDTFESILGGFSNINEVGEGAALQLIVQPAADGVKRGIMQKLKLLKEGKPASAVLGKKSFITFSDVGKTLSPGNKAGEKPEKINVDEEAVKALTKKISKPLFNVNVRIITSAPTSLEADTILNSITAGFSQLTSPQHNEVKLVKPRNLKKFLYQFAFREFDESQAFVLNSEELASMHHFPISTTAVPNIARLKFREGAPPVNLPKEGVILGQNRYRGAVKEIRMTRDDRRRHLYVIGQTGTGKSVTLKNLAIQDMQNGEGVCVIDPNGDLIEDMLALVPKERVQDVIVFDPGNLSHPLAINMLEYNPAFPEQKTFQINELLNIFDTLYDLKATGGPAFEQYVRYTLLLLMNDPSDGFTLLEVPRVLADAPFRKYLLAKCSDPLVVDFWEKQAEKAGGEGALANMAPYITNKFNAFLANDFVRPIVAQSKSSLDFRRIMDDGKILFVNLSKGRIGEMNARLLGMIIVGKLTIAAFSRTDITDMEKRRDFYLHIDEFQNFTTPSIATILSEARKYRLCLTAAHQFIAQLKEDIKNAIFGNVGSIIVFRVGADDAEYLAKQFEPYFAQNDLMNVANLNGYAKIIVNGTVAPPFSIFMPFPPRGSKELAESIKELSRLKYGKNLKEIEEDILERYKRF